MGHSKDYWLADRMAQTTVGGKVYWMARLKVDP